MFAEAATDGAEATGTDLATWLDQCRALLGRYFTLEDPQRLEPAEREVHVATQLESGLTIHGYIDRVDVAPPARCASSTTRPAGPRRVLRGQGAVPDEVLRAGASGAPAASIPRDAPARLPRQRRDAALRARRADLLATERKVLALWEAIQRATESGDFRPNKSVLCGWCDHQAICPAWGGTPPPIPLP